MNAPAHFQKSVLSIADLGDSCVVVYLDDIVVYGASKSEVWEKSKLVLKRLVDAGFMINTRKTKFLVQKVKVLGYELEGGMVQPNAKKLEVLLQYK